MIRKFFLTLLFGSLLTVYSCDNSGICTEPVTPKLMTGFFEKDNLNNEKSVAPPADLKIYGNKDGKNIIGDSDDTKYMYPNLVKTNEDLLLPLIFDTNEDSLTLIFNFEGDIIDTLELTYKRKQKFVNLDCGYKSIFYDVEINSYTENKIDTLILQTNYIEYDTEQHIKIRLK